MFTILNNILKEMYDAKGIILKQKNCRWHMTTIKSYSNISRFKSIFAKEQFLNYLKTNFVI